MTTAVLGYSRVYNKVQSKISSISVPRIDWKIIFIAGFLMCSFLLTFYIYQIIDLTKTSYSINSYESKIAGISRDNKNLEVSFAENNFLAEVLEKAHEIGFQRTSSITYIHILNNSVAKAK